MPIFNEFNITKTSDIAWDGGKPTENLIPHDGDLVFESTGSGGRSTVLLPYIEQHGETDDDGFIISWTTGDGSKGWDSVGQSLPPRNTRAAAYSSSASKTFLITPPVPHQSRAFASTEGIWGAASI
jgi:hypothetical protein